MTSSTPDPPTWRVSTTFYPGAQLSSSVNEPPDIVLNTIPEEVHFYVHSSFLLRRSINAFAFLISPQTSVHSMPSNPSPYSLYQQNAYVAPSRSESRSTSGGSGESSRSNSTAQQMPQVIISVHENADVLNLLLHAVYDISPERYAPSLDTLSRLPGALLNYGYSLEDHIAPGSELTRLFLVYARDQPLEVYALAASYHLEHLAQRASKPSLAAHLSMMTEQQVKSLFPAGDVMSNQRSPLVGADDGKVGRTCADLNDAILTEARLSESAFTCDGLYCSISIGSLL